MHEELIIICVVLSTGYERDIDGDPSPGVKHALIRLDDVVSGGSGLHLVGKVALRGVRDGERCLQLAGCVVFDRGKPQVI